MIEKRFTILYETEENPMEWDLIDNQTDCLIVTGNGKAICDLLNELNDENDILKQKLKTKYIVNKQYEELQKVKKENEQLKLDKQHLYRAMSREEVRHKQFRDKVFDLIEGRIKHYSHKPISAPISQPMSVNFDADMDRLARLSELELLKEELLK